MTSLAGLLQAAGARVTGSDGRLYPPTSEILSSLGLEVGEGFDPSRLDPAPDVVVIGNAISRGNPEVEAVLDRDLNYTSMPSLIARRFLKGRHPIVVAGTHGKTTTASMLAWVLTSAGRDPGFLIGGQPSNFDRPFHLGNGPAFVIEGDEYDSAFFDKGPKFMHYRPRTAILGTVEFDHADIYADLEAVQRAFGRLVNLVPKSGLLCRHEGCEATREASEGAFGRIEGFGLDAGEWRAADLEEGADGARFRLMRKGEELAEIRLQVSGAHNVLNALAVSAAATEQGLTPDELARGLAGFRGVRRRMETRGCVDGVTVLDDFAHHPTAIEATIRAVRRRFPDGRVWAVCEPRSWSLRRSVFQERLAGALAGADEIVMAAVYQSDKIPESERLDPQRVIDELVGRGASARHLPQVAEILELLVESTRPGDVVAIMSNGAFEGLHDRLLEGLRARSTTPRTA